MPSSTTLRQKVIGAVMAVVAVAGMCLATAAVAQSIEQPPLIGAVDQNGVNLANGELSLPDLSVATAGIGRNGQAFLKASNRGIMSTDNFTGSYVVKFEGAAVMGSPYPAGPYWLYVSYQGNVRRFMLGSGYYGNPSSPPSLSAGPYEEIGSPSPAKLDCGTATGQQVNDYAATCTLKLADTTEVIYVGSGPAQRGLVTKITSPTGEVSDLTYYKDGNNAQRAINTVNNSLGWALKYTVDANFVVTGVTAVNTTLSQCVETTCTPNAGAPVATVAISSGTRTFSLNSTGVAGTTTIGSYVLSGDTVTITAPGGVTKIVTLYPTTNTAYTGRVKSVKLGNSTWNYSYGNDAITPAVAVTTVQAPNGTTRKTGFEFSKKKIVYQIDEASRKTAYIYDGYDRVLKVINPDGNETTGGFTAYKYGARGNIEKTFIVPKNGITGGIYENATNLIVTTATYAIACDAPTVANGNYKYCNKPLSVTDTNGIRTDYEYHSASGQVAKIRTPAVSGVQPEVRNKYEQKTPTAKYPGATMSSQPQVWRLTETSSCMTQNLATCVGSIDERKTTLTYSSAGNILPVSTAISRGNGSLTQATAVTYNNNGAVLVTDGPQPGSIDEVYTLYDTLGRVEGTVNPDPDGSSGPQKRNASRSYYDTAGRVWKTVVGTVPTSAYSGNTAGDRSVQARADFDALSPQTTDTIEFSSAGLPAISRHFIGSETGTLKDVAQRSYDNMLRVDCEAVRLKAADYALISSKDPCVLGSASGTETKDRIIKYNYDATTGILLSTSVGYGTGLVKISALKNYDTSGTNSTGTLLWVEDAKGNRTSYYYDAFNRLIKTCYPMIASVHASSTTDCEQTAFRTTPITGSGSVGSVANTVTLRDNQVITFAYDAAGRLSTKSGAIIESYIYDNFGQVTEHKSNSAGHLLNATTQARQANTYNALGWILTATTNIVTASDASTTTNKTVTYQYDAYGRRSQMTYPENDFYITYGYNSANELVRICENGLNCAVGNISLLNFSRDDYGRRISTTGRKADGTALTLGAYEYDASLRLQKVTVPGNMITLGYGASDQISSRTNGTAIFDPAAPSASTTNYGVNGLNQMSPAGASTLSYDTRGNMSSDGAVSYVYNAANLLISTTTGATLKYDAENRLRMTAVGSIPSRQFLYDGVDLIAEYDSSGGVLRRYVHGAGSDEPLVWYEKNGSAYDKRFFASDERGSITAVTSDSGVVLSQYIYDVYGMPTKVSGSIDSSFLYTGQVWLSDLSLYYYKARMYAPSLGRFMQRDPIGYGDGMNWYAYVGNDPVGRTDSTGLCDEPTWGCPGQGNYLGSDDQYDVTVYYTDGSVGSFTTNDARYDRNGADAWGWRNASAGLSPMLSATNTSGVGTTLGGSCVAGAQCLSFTTLSGGPGHSEWKGMWSLSEPSSKGGWIVQAINGVGAPFPNYWEAWHVSAGHVITDTLAQAKYDDIFAGRWTVQASARFYEGVDLNMSLQDPNSFRYNNTFTQAGLLPATTVDPNLPLGNATPPVNRTWP